MNREEILQASRNAKQKQGFSRIGGRISGRRSCGKSRGVGVLHVFCAVLPRWLMPFFTASGSSISAFLRLQWLVRFLKIRRRSRSGIGDTVFQPCLFGVVGACLSSFRGGRMTMAQAEKPLEGCTHKPAFPSLSWRKMVGVSRNPSAPSRRGQFNPTAKWLLSLIALDKKFRNCFFRRSLWTTYCF